MRHDPNYHKNEIEKKILEFFNKFSKGGMFLPILFLVGIGIYGSFYTVEPDEEAVIIRLGKYTTTASPGLHFKLPFGIDKAVKIQTTKIHQAEFGFRTSNVSLGSRTQYDKNRGNLESESLMLTGDLNVADVEWVVQYKISDPYKYLFAAANPIQNIRDVSESIMRRVVGDQLVNDVLTTGRASIASEARELMQGVIDRYDIGILITTVKLQDVNPPDRVKASFNEVNAAKQEQEKMINQAEKRYNKIIPEARGKSEEQVSTAEGYAEAIINKAKGDASRFSQVLKEYKRFPKITRKRMYLEAMEGVFRKFDKLTIVDSKVKGLLPIFQKSMQEVKSE